MSYQNVQLIKFESPPKKKLIGLASSCDKNRGVIFIHGFNGTTVNTRTRKIIDEISGRASTFQFDFSGSPLYRGDIKDFEEMNVEKYVGELEAAVRTFKSECSLKEINLVSHSLGGCIVLQLLHDSPSLIGKAVFLSPGFNQEELIKYWFVQQSERGEEISWSNFKNYFSEERFQKELAKEKRKVGENYVSTDYFKENQDKDYQELFKDLEFNLKNLLVVYGTDDEVVPPDSNNEIPEEVKKIKVIGGEHDLDDPDLMKEYLTEVVNFVTKGGGTNKAVG